MNELALYLHIPFCRRRCRYCDFPSSTGREDLIAFYRDSLIRELRLEEPVWREAVFKSVFFGGGTPTLWPAGELVRVMNAIVDTGHLSADAEITIEANPGTVDRAGLTRLREAGFNRLSLGAQCGDDRLLQAVGRIHSRVEVEAAVRDARDAGFANLNLDLMAGLPGQTLSDWERTLEWATAFKPQHLSCYGLQLEEGTPLADDVARGLLILPPEEETAEMLESAMARLPRQGLEQYEISNYAREGFACRHNIVYWTRGNYLGLGAGATSTIGDLRWTNTPDLDAYIRGVFRDDPPRETERIAPRQAMLETIMLGLRLRRGLNREAFEAGWQCRIEELLGDDLRELLRDGWLEEEGPNLRLARRAVLVGNEVIARLCRHML